MELGTIHGPSTPPARHHSSAPCLPSPPGSTPTTAGADRIPMSTFQAPVHLRIYREQASDSFERSRRAPDSMLHDFANLMARAQSAGWNLVALDLGVDLPPPPGSSWPMSGSVPPSGSAGSSVNAPKTPWRRSGPKESLSDDRPSYLRPLWDASSRPEVPGMAGRLSLGL